MSRVPFSKVEEPDDEVTELDAVIADRDGWKRLADKQWKEVASLRVAVEGWRDRAEQLEAARDAAVRDGQNMMLDYRESRDAWRRRAEALEAVLQQIADNGGDFRVGWHSVMAAEALASRPVGSPQDTED